MTSKVRVTVLVENTAQGPGMLAEHGLAYWIQWGDQQVLFDTGQGGVLAGNAYKLGIPLREADAVVLSHGHYDHTGGLAEALRSNRPMAVYLHPAALEAKYARNKDGTSREIGMPLPSRQALGQQGHRVVLTETSTPVLDGLAVTGHVPRTTDFEDTGGPFFLDAACSTPDPLADDQSIFFDTKEGIVVLLGCAHSGVVNTLRYISDLSSGKPIHTVIGGMHLVQASPERNASTIEELRKFGVRLLAPCHCTGMPAMVALWNAFPGTCVACHVGRTFEFHAPYGQAVDCEDAQRWRAVEKHDRLAR